MKNIIFIVSLVLFSTVFFSCENDDLSLQEELLQQEQFDDDLYNTGDDDDDGLEEPTDEGN